MRLALVFHWYLLAPYLSVLTLMVRQHVPTCKPLCLLSAMCLVCCQYISIALSECLQSIGLLVQVQIVDVSDWNLAVLQHVGHWTRAHQPHH